MAKKRRRVRRKSNALALKFLIVLLTLALCGVGVMAVYAFNSYRSNNKLMQDAVATDRIYKNIYINGVNVGGLSREAAQLLLKKEFIPDLQDNSVTVTADGNTLLLSFGEFSARYDFTAAVDEAYAYARTGTLKERYDMVMALEEQPYVIEFEPGYTYERGNISGRLEPLRDAVNIEPLNASITRKDGQFILSDSRTGRVLDSEATVDLIVAVLDSGQSGTVAAVINEILPEYEADDFSDVQSLIGTFTTKVVAGATSRNTNIRNALSKINDIVLYPGEVFSTNKHFGSMTYDNGYREASVIVNGKIEDGMGGGVCQVSSTLYNAVLLAELEVVERRNHSLKVAYVDYGFDATLAGDYIDFKFRNDTDAPVFIEASLNNNTDVVVNLYGREVHSPLRTLKFEKKLIETVNPEAPIEKEDPMLAIGERLVVSKPSTGYKYSVYKTVYENGSEVETVHVNTSYYRPARGEVHVGTGTGIGEQAQASADAMISPEEFELADPAPIQPDEFGQFGPAPIQPDEYGQFDPVPMQPDEYGQFDPAQTDEPPTIDEPQVTEPIL